MARSIAVWIWVSAIFVAYLNGIKCATFEILNQCPYTVWAAASPGGGRQLGQGETWVIQVPSGSGKIWGRTSCSFDGNGRGKCTTGDCGGLLDCQGYGQVPATLAEYAVNQLQKQDFYDISLVDGFNLPLSMTPTNSQCKSVTCLTNINEKCPSELRVTDGCKSACAQFNTPQYCCTGAYENNCSTTNYSQFFKGQCPEAYSYSRDDATSTFTCPTGTNYKVVFCGGKVSSIITVLIDITILN